MSRRLSEIFISLLLFVSAVPAMAQQNVSLRLDNADIQELIRWGADHIDKNVIVHPNVKGNVTVMAGAPLNDAQAYSVFVSILEVHGFSVVETEDAVKVIPSKLAVPQYAPLRERADASNFDDLDTRVISLLNLSPKQAEPLLKPLLSASAYLKAVPDSNLIVLADRVGAIDRAISLLEEIDQPNPYEVRVVGLRYAKAKTLMDHTTALLPQLFEKDATQGVLTLRSDERTNALLISGPPLYVEQSYQLIQRLDQPARAESATHVVPVEFLTADELIAPLESLANLLESQEGSENRAQSKVLIGKNDTQNALIITAPEYLYRKLLELVTQLDVSRAQVLVEAAIVEMSAEKVLNLGVEWRYFNEGDGVIIGSSVPGQLPVPEAPDFGGGFTFGYFSSDDFWVVVRALAGDSDNNLLSTPTIVSLDNQPAEILVGENVPFLTGSATNAASPTTNPFQTIQREDIGISLKITPKINNRDSVTLEISQAIEQISPSAAETADIVTNKREINTTVLIEDKEVLVLGGLIRDDITEVRSKVPVLGDIPILGQAFRSTTNQETKRNLMVFIHPRILRHRGDKAGVTNSYLRRLDRLREERDERAYPLFRSPPSEEPAEGILFPTLRGGDKDVQPMKTTLTDDT